MLKKWILILGCRDWAKIMTSSVLYCFQCVDVSQQLVNLTHHAFSDLRYELDTQLWEGLIYHRLFLVYAQMTMQLLTLPLKGQTINQTGLSLDIIL